MPIAQIDSLAPLVDPVIAERGLRALLARNGGATSPGIADLAIMLKLVAQRHVRISDAGEARISELAKRLAAPAPQGLTEKNRTP